ncbi:PAS domain S-box protein [Salidesulfovibrio onnuriiensis]|uniref:PAS domain S-box protein n=1 Tax=Salidesulfovibrio onnuriiensis TaxID=2583823 RepID=UPI0011C8E927|nr:PAS domain S-box protein [Salidesulfovibrio onnuriiensis]
MLNFKKRISVLAVIMAVLVGVATFTSTLLLYETSLDQQRVRLRDIVHSQALLIQAIHRRNVDISRRYSQDPPLLETLRQVARAHGQFRMGDKSGEFTIAQREDNDIRFLLINGRNGWEFDESHTTPVNIGLAEPSVKALDLESGSMIGEDYRGATVLAAYEPLTLSNTRLGIVAKIDIAEIRKPYIRSSLMALGTGLCFITLGIVIFFRTSEPLIENLKHSEEKYKHLVEGAKSLIIRVGKDMKIVFANDYTCKYLGCSQDEIVNASINDLLFRHSDTGRHFDSLEKLITPALDNAGIYETPFTHPDGHKVRIAWTINGISNEGGFLEELLLIGNDITLRYLAQKAQQEVEERFRGITKASPVGVIITDMQGNLVYANETIHELTGQEAAELAGDGWFEIIHADYRPDIIESWFAEDRNAPILRNEFRIQMPGEAEGWVLGQSVPMHNAAGSLVGYVVTLTDITRIKTTELQYQKLYAATTQMTEGVIITTTSGEIQYVNPAFETITGYSQDDALGKKPNILKSGEHDTTFYQQLWRTISAGSTWRGTIINKRKDGKIYHQETSIGPVRNDSGEIVNYVGIIRDISGQLAMETQLRHNQKLESIGELAAGIAHEINTPTQYVGNNTHFIYSSFKTLMGMTDNCRRLVEAIREGGDNETIRQLAEKAIDEKELEFLAEDIPAAVQESLTGIDRISKIVQSIKQLAHPGEMEMAYHDLNAVIRNAVIVSTNEWKYAANLESELDEELPEIKCMESELGQVMLNLIVNAAHAIEARYGESPQEKGTIAIRSFQEGDRAVVQVRDNGTGMPQKVIDRAFDPFFTTKQVGKGTGQGLAIAHNVVVGRHCGSIEIESEEGVGTTFTVRLPFEPACKME